MTATLTLTPKQQFFDANGNPLVGGKLYSYSAGTTSPVVTYVDSAGVTTNTNPIILDSRGEANVWLGTGTFKFKLVSATDVEIWTVDNIPGAPASNAALVALAASNGSSLVGYLPAGTGAVATTVQAELRKSKKVSNYSTVQQAFDDCIANNYDLEVDQIFTLTSSINIDRLVDGAAYDNYFRVFTTNGGGFVVTTAMAMFSSSIAFTTSPVSQLVFFDGLTFIGNSGASYVLDDGRFLRTRFDGCNFDKILCCNSTIYTQSIYITNCNIRRIVGTFWTSTAFSADFKFIGNICEAITGDILNLAAAYGCNVSGNLMEGCTGTAIKYNGAQGFCVSGNYFEANLLDIDGTGATQAAGVAITGNRFSHTSGNSVAATYSVVWGSSCINCVSMGNYHDARMHNFPTAGMDVLVKDSATMSVFNNEPNPIFVTTMAFNDGALGNTYGGQVKGYGVGGLGGYVGLGVLNAGVYTEGITVAYDAKTTINNTLTIKGSTPSVEEAQLGLGVTTAPTVGAAGGASVLPASPSAYLQINISGTFYKIPIYAN